MKMYSKPTIEFIELKPEEKLACGSGATDSFANHCNCKSNAFCCNLPTPTPNPTPKPQPPRSHPFWFFCW
jgi:hypothetical protein